MKKIILLLFMFIFLSSNAQTLKGGVSEEYISSGFYGSWGVISKLKNATNLSLFNYESRDIWVLSGYSNILILENLESGAYSQIEIKEKTQDGKTLKFQREKTVNRNDSKIKYIETVKFILNGNNFSGSDDFVVEYYSKDNKFLKKETANYAVEGVRISGTKP